MRVKNLHTTSCIQRSCLDFIATLVEIFFSTKLKRISNRPRNISLNISEIKPQLLLMCLLLTTISCRQDRESFLPTTDEMGSLTLHFSMTSPSYTRNVTEEVILYYIVEDGEMTPCQISETFPETRIGDGNTADGGGMADLRVFLVDANDNIIARQSFSNLPDTTTQTMNFLNLPSGEYTAYAYANTEGNDWFSMPSESETSFASYKDATMKGLGGATPTIQNGRMPLTAKQDIIVQGGENARTISMLRPVGKLSITVSNQKTGEAVTTADLSFGNTIPHTGYVFKHDDILPQSTSNPYYALESNQSYNIFPATAQVIFETLLYETNAEAGFQITLSHKEEAEFDYQENFSGTLNSIKKDDKFIVKIKDVDKFLRLSQTTNGQYRLEAVTTTELDEQCFWRLNTGGNQQRALINTYHEVSLNMSNGIVSFDGAEIKYGYSGGADYTIIGQNGVQLRYDAATGNFTTSSNGTHFQFYQDVIQTGSDVVIANTTPILVQNPQSDTSIPLTTIFRNQHIKLNIIYR